MAQSAAATDSAATAFSRNICQRAPIRGSSERGSERGSGSSWVGVSDGETGSSSAFGEQYDGSGGEGYESAGGSFPASPGLDPTARGAASGTGAVRAKAQPLQANARGRGGRLVGRALAQPAEAAARSRVALRRACGPGGEARAAPASAPVPAALRDQERCPQPPCAAFALCPAARPGLASGSTAGGAPAAAEVRALAGTGPGAEAAGSAMAAGGTSILDVEFWQQRVRPAGAAAGNGSGASGAGCSAAAAGGGRRLAALGSLPQLRQPRGPGARAQGSVAGAGLLGSLRMGGGQQQQQPAHVP